MGRGGQEVPRFPPPIPGKTIEEVQQAMTDFRPHADLIWSVAEILRGPYRPNQYKDVMLPMTVLRRLDSVLEPTKEKVLEARKKFKDKGAGVLDAKLKQAAGVPFYNTSKFTFEELRKDPDGIAPNLTHYIKSFSRRAREIFGHFGFEEQIAKLEKADRLYLLVSRFCEVDLHPDRVPNYVMGLVFEDLIRRFNEASNEEAGDHFTPREVIRLNAQAFAICSSDMMIKGHEIEKIDVRNEAA